MLDFVAFSLHILMTTSQTVIWSDNMNSLNNWNINLGSTPVGSIDVNNNRVELTPNRNSVYIETTTSYDISPFIGTNVILRFNMQDCGVSRFDDNEVCAIYAAYNGGNSYIEIETWEGDSDDDSLPGATTVRLDETKNSVSLRFVATNRQNSNIGPETCCIDQVSLEHYTSSPTKKPTLRPTFNPTKRPTPNPTDSPTKTPTINPTSETLIPTGSPTNVPTSETISPTAMPTNIPTNMPSNSPTNAPTLVTLSPTVSPTNVPTSETILPTESPTNSPSEAPTEYPSLSPTIVSILPTKTPTQLPTRLPTPITTYPTKSPTNNPTTIPSIFPSNSPSIPPSTTNGGTTNTKTSGKTVTSIYIFEISD